MFAHKILPMGAVGKLVKIFPGVISCFTDTFA